MTTPTIKRNPWSWIPTLYFAEGLPYVAVMTIAVIMYKRLGLSNTEIALYTSWLYLPWTIKPLWSPFVDLLLSFGYWHSVRLRMTSQQTVFICSDSTTRNNLSL